MKPRLLWTALFTGALSAALSTGAAAQGRQDLGVLKSTVEQFLKVQAAGLPGEVTVNVGAIDNRMALAPCPDPQAFMMPGARAWGKTTVGVRCAAPSAWTIYIQANVTVVGDYLAAAAPLVQGQPIDANQLTTLKGDLTMLPPGIATDASQVIGRSPTVSLPPGTPLRLDTLKTKPVVQSGQLVRIISSGNGFSVSGEGRAMSTAGDGQVVQVKAGNGQQITGIAKSGGLVEVAF
ncbi:flagellar basal body P-ring formation protein FlgA [Duganella sp. FT80W]|uniref:Flagella basal body P-ring formation protein FlgA n=1 Tax=Duganella guangzhouensis TaxID=2666084 RepID=A0A6I2L2T5_9BURK|nr:flagellar basal body P-ring formation chaperone FlgA [Duganella guangzhouensis]MRW92112.1 flagellar basal body P-ring formation protein FlgA [Duganella guangzhouensis]